MKPARKPIAQLITIRSRATQTPLLQRVARQAHAAECSATDAPTDATTQAAMSLYLDRTRDLAGLPGSNAGEVAVKLASLLRLRLGDQPGDFDECQRAEFILLASALADLVILGEALS